MINSKQTVSICAQDLGRLTQSEFLARHAAPVLVEIFHTDIALVSRTAHTENFEWGDKILDSIDPDHREVLFVEKRSGAENAGRISLGRGPDLDIFLPRKWISKVHADFSNFNGTFRVTDKESLNGTFVAGKRLTPGETAALHDGVELQFAAYSFEFMYPERFYEFLQAVNRLAAYASAETAANESSNRASRD